MKNQTKSKESASDKSRLDILNAAAEAFNVAGLEGASIDAIAEKLGCTKGYIYYYYKSKIDLYLDVYATALEMNLTTLEPIACSNADARTKMKQMIEAQALLDFEHLAFERISMQGVEFHLRGSTTPGQRTKLQDLLAMRDRYEEMFIRVISDGIKSGVFHSYSPRFAAKPILGALNWITVWYRPKRGETNESRRALAEQMSEFLLGALDKR